MRINRLLLSAAIALSAPAFAAIGTVRPAIDVLSVPAPNVSASLSVMLTGSLAAVSDSPTALPLGEMSVLLNRWGYDESRLAQMSFTDRVALVAEASNEISRQVDEAIERSADPASVEQGTDSRQMLARAARLARATKSLGGFARTSADKIPAARANVVAQLEKMHAVNSALLLRIHEMSARLSRSGPREAGRLVDDLRDAASDPAAGAAGRAVAGGALVSHLSRSYGERRNARTLEAIRVIGLSAPDPKLKDSLARGLIADFQAGKSAVSVHHPGSELNLASLLAVASGDRDTMRYIRDVFQKMVDDQQALGPVDSRIQPKRIKIAAGWANSLRDRVAVSAPSVAREKIPRQSLLARMRSSVQAGVKEFIDAPRAAVAFLSPRSLTDRVLGGLLRVARVARWNPWTTGILAAMITTTGIGLIMVGALPASVVLIGAAMAFVAGFSGISNHHGAAGLLQSNLVMHMFSFASYVAATTGPIGIIGAVATIGAAIYATALGAHYFRRHMPLFGLAASALLLYLFV